MENSFYAIVLSGGAGKRMGGDVPKQYRLLNGKPVLYYSLASFEKSRVKEVILVVAEGMEEHVKTEIVDAYGLTKVTHIVSGGKERSDSVREGLRVVPDQGYVLIHDGARPFLSMELLERIMVAVARDNACIPAVPVKDTIKRVKNAKIIATPERNELYAAQTPQAFLTAWIKKAFELADARGNVTVTDDAMMVEEMLGEKVRVVDGEYRNIKITNPEDMVIAEAFLPYFEN